MPQFLLPTGLARPLRAAGIGRVAPSALGAVVLVNTAVRLVLAALLPLHQDEAYHYLFTLHPALSYYDHPPMVMWVAWLGVAACGGVVSPFSVRLGFTLLLAGSVWVAGRVTARWYGERAGALAALLLAASGYHGNAGGMVLPESPLLFFSLLTTWAVARAVLDHPGRTAPWVGVGLALAGAMLSKYFAVLLPAGVVAYVALTPAARRLLLTPGPYVGVAVGALGFAPVLVWNATHGWASFAFQGNRTGATNIDLGMVLGRMLTSVACLYPWVWAVLVAGLVAAARRAGAAGPDRFFVLVAAVPLAAFYGLATFVVVLPHWPLYGFVFLLPPAGAWLARQWELRPRAVRAGVVAGYAVAVLAAAGAVVQVRYAVIPVRKSPADEFGRWGTVADQLAARGLLDRPNTFLFTCGWTDAAQLQVALAGRPVPVACYSAGEARGFAYWSRPADYLGMDGLYVTLGDEVYAPALYELFFRQVDPVAEFEVTRGGRPFRTARVYLCTEQLRPFARSPCPTSWRRR